MVLDTTFESFQVSNQVPCPVCGKVDWCYVRADHKGRIFWALCGRETDAPSGWVRTGTSRDNRGIYTLESAQFSRKFFSREIQIHYRDFDSGPQWLPHTIPPETAITRGDRVLYSLGKTVEIREILKTDYRGGKWRYTVGPNEECDAGFVQGIATHDPATGATERVITFEYGPQHKVVRYQWSDRRTWYDQGKTKQVRPHHATTTTDGGLVWQAGRGEEKWPLYREAEALEAIALGRTLFVVGGETCVEALRGLGLYATCWAGGENRWHDAWEQLRVPLAKARKDRKVPHIVLWGDYDVVGDSNFGQLERRIAEDLVRVVSLDPVEVWEAMPAKGDAVDWLAAHPNTPEQTLRDQITAAINKAVDRAELAREARDRAENWGAPESNKGELGYSKVKRVWRENDEGRMSQVPERVYTPVTNFDYQILRQIEGPPGAGYLLGVKVVGQAQEVRAMVWPEDLATTAAFRKRLNKETGIPIFCKLKDDELQSLNMVRDLEYKQRKGGKRFRLIDRVGKQADGTWVFKNAQLTPSGQVTTEDRSGWMWEMNLLGPEDMTKPPALSPANPDALKALVDLCFSFFGDNAPIALLLMGWSTACLKFDQIIQADGGFPVLSVYGDPGGGKTELLRAALSIVGNHWGGLITSLTKSSAYEMLSKASCLPLVWDDPEKSPMLEELLKNTYNAFGRKVRGADKDENIRGQQPRTAIAVSSNHAIGENQGATQSRLTKIFVPFIKNGDTSEANYYRLRAAMDLASGSFPQLVKIQHPTDRIQEISALLNPHLRAAHSRIPRSFALLIAYAEQVQALSGNNIDLLGWVIQHICPSLNRAEESGNSLADFLGKLFDLKTLAKVGEWNLRVCHKAGGGKTLAVHVNSIWPTFETTYTVAYSKNTLIALMEISGATKGTQRFHEDMQSSLDWRRAEQAARMQGSKISDLAKPRECLKRCHELPWDLVQEFAFFAEDVDPLLTVLTDPPNSTQSQAQSHQTLLTESVNNTENSVNSVNRNCKQEGSDQLCLQEQMLTNPPLLTGSVNSPNPYPESDRGQFTPLVNTVNRQNTPMPEKILGGVDLTLSASSPGDVSNFTVPTRLKKGDRLWCWAGTEWKEAEYLGQKRNSTFSVLTRSLGQGIRIRWIGGLDVAIALEDVRIQVNAQVSAQEA
jgi:hypothetical protein